MSDWILKISDTNNGNKSYSDFQLRVRNEKVFSSNQTYAVGTPKNRRSETVLLSTQDIS